MITTDSSAWVKTTKAPPLRHNEVHVWRISLADWDPHVHSLSGLLSEEEAARAHRFLFEEDRRRYTIARGILRTVLGEYLKAAPESLGIALHKGGKPFVAEPTAKPPVRFNLSHAGEEILCAVALGTEVGVDIERLDRQTDHLALAERFFSPRELESLHSLSGPELAQRFFTCWVRKEAFIKAIGTGLSMPLQSFTVSTEPGDAFTIATDSGEAWAFQDTPEIPGYAGCLVTQGKDTSARFFWRAV